MIESLLRRAAKAAYRQSQLVLVLALVIVAVALVPALRLRFDTGILGLLPPDDPDVRTFTEAIETFGSQEALLVVVRISPDAALAPYLDLIDLLGTELERLEEVEAVDYSIGEPGSLADWVLRRSYLLLDDEARARMLERLTNEGLRRRARELRRKVSAPPSPLGTQLLRLDPLGVSELLLTSLPALRGGPRVDWSLGYLLSEDHTLALLVVRPRRAAMEPEFARSLMTRVGETRASVLERWPDLAGAQAPPPQIDFGGAYATIAEDARNMGLDVITSFATALLGVLLLFTVAFRRLGVIVYAFVPLLVGVVLALGFAGAVFGRLSVISSGFAALLLGLALDFVIVSYARYVEERRLGAGPPAALAAMAGTAGRTVVTGAVTTAATFFVFLVTRFAGLRQMGLLTGSGILLCMVAVLILLPALIASSEKRRARRRSHRDLRLHAFGLGALVSACYRRPVVTLVAGGLLSAAALHAAVGLRFEDDFRKLRPPGSRGVEVQQEVIEAFGSAFNTTIVVVEAADERELLERVHRASRALGALVDDGLVGGTASLADVLPDAADQRAAIAWLEEHADRLDGERLRRDFAAAAAAVGLRADAFRQGLDALGVAARIREPIGLEDLGAQPWIERLLGRYVRRGDGRLRAVVHVRPVLGEGKPEVPPELQAVIDELGEGFVLTGASLVGGRLRAQIRSDAVLACLIGFAFVFALLYFEYRGLTDTVLSLVPLSVGLLWMLAGMRWLGLSMNFFNVFVTTMIIGIGVDYGIHMVNRYREHAGEAPAELSANLRETGRAVLLAALSTIVGFGSLSLSHYPGLKSMGLVAVLGALASALVSVTVLPALLALRRQRAAARDARGA